MGWPEKTGRGEGGKAVAWQTHEVVVLRYGRLVGTLDERTALGATADRQRRALIIAAGLLMLGQRRRHAHFDMHLAHLQAPRGAHVSKETSHGNRTRHNL